MIRKLHKSQEEKIADKVAELLSDVRLDLDQVGIYLARYSPNLSYNRLMIIAEAAEHEKEREYDRQNLHPLF